LCRGVILYFSEEGPTSEKRPTRKLSSEEKKERKEKLRQNKLEKLEVKEERRREKEVQRATSFRTPPPIKEVPEQ
jgi:hypothetical protein